MIGIYKITSPTNKVYIGQSWDLERRKISYKNLSGCREQPRIYNSLKKYGFDSHDFEVLLNIKDDLKYQKWLDYWEQFFINYFRSEGYELMNIKEAGAYGKHNPETIEYLKLINQGDVNKNCKPVIQYSLSGDFIKRWNSISTAGRDLKLDRKAINNCCIGYSKSSYGFKWIYAN